MNTSRLDKSSNVSEIVERLSSARPKPTRIKELKYSRSKPFSANNSPARVDMFGPS